MSPSSVGSVVTTTYNDPSHYLSSSISSLSSQRARLSWLVRTYRQAAQLYLTRRLAEAMDAIEPAVFPESLVLGEDASQNVTPVAQSSRGTRVKIWSFYLTLVNAIIELGPEEGKVAFGSTKWKLIASKARTGSIWDEVVRHGYGGSEGHVDGEVIANLATLLLTHMADQHLNQRRLENYLAACMHPSFDITAHMQSSLTDRPVSQRTDSGGTSTPRDLNTRLKLLELYTLNILPRNEEWDYARDFISMSEVLDEERREAFLGALEQLREERSLEAIRAAELRKRKEQEQEQHRESEARQRREEAQAVQREKPEDRGAKNMLKPESSTNTIRPSRSTAVPGQPKQPPKPNRPLRKNQPPPSGIAQRASQVLSAMQASILHATASMQKNPMAALRLLLFIFAFLIAMARRNVRQRIGRTLDVVVVKLKQTLGMGVKVSYI